MRIKMEPGEMSSPDDDVFFDQFAEAAANDDGAAAKEHLAAGRPIYYRERDTPADLVIKKFPDGHRQLVSFENGTEQFVADLSAV